MNQYDQNNLMFLLSLDAEGFDCWLAQVSLDDIEYALELLQYHRARVSLMAVECNDAVEDLTEAKQLIDFIRSK